MMFFKVLRYDLQNGTLKAFRKFLLAIAIFLISALDFSLRAPSMQARLNAAHATLGDYFAYVNFGMREYVVGSPEPFRFPALWMLFLLFALYMVLYYPYNDLYGYGKQVLVNARSRTSWWFAKCAWLIVSQIIYFALFFLTVTLFAKARGAVMTLEVSEYIFVYNIPPTDLQFPLPGSFNVELLLFPFLLVVALGLLQLLLSLVIRPILSYVVSIALLIASAYYVSPFMVGNYAMLARSNQVVLHGVDSTMGIIYLAGIAVFSMVVGWLYFYRFDILSNERI